MKLYTFPLFLFIKKHFFIALIYFSSIFFANQSLATSQFFSDENEKDSPSPIGVDETESCSICLEEVGLSSDIKKCSVCKNVIHTNCLETWLKVQDSCPLCRSAPFVILIDAESIRFALEGVRSGLGSLYTSVSSSREITSKINVVGLLTSRLFDKNRTSNRKEDLSRLNKAIIDHCSNSDLFVDIIVDHPLFLESILNLDIDINVRDSNGQTPLHLVVIRLGDDYEAIIDRLSLLFAYGSDPNLVDSNGDTPLLLFIRRLNDFITQSVSSIPEEAFSDVSTRNFFVRNILPLFSSRVRNMKREKDILDRKVILSCEIINLFLVYGSNCYITNKNKFSVYEIIDLIPEFYRSRVFGTFFIFTFVNNQRCVLRTTDEPYDDFNVHDSYQPPPGPPSSGRGGKKSLSPSSSYSTRVSGVKSSVSSSNSKKRSSSSSGSKKSLNRSDLSFFSYPCYAHLLAVVPLIYFQQKNNHFIPQTIL